jgi:hypothetical protein
VQATLDRAPDLKEGSPILKEAFMEVVENQIRDGDPPETRETLERLKSEGISEEDARLYIGQAVCVEVWDIMKNKKEFNMVRFIRNLKALPAEPKE